MQPKTLAIIASVVLLAALISLQFTLGSAVPKVNRSVYTSLGQVLAQETAGAIHDRGQIVVVVADAYDQFGTVLRDQWKAFSGELQNHAGIHLATPETRPPGQHVPLGEVIDRYPQAAAIVFFVDTPDAPELEAAANRAASPKLVVVGNPDLPTKNYYGKFMASGLLAAVIIPRSFSDRSRAGKAQSQRDWFDQYYLVYTPQTIDTLSE